MFRIGTRKLPKGAYIKLLYGGTEYKGICRGIEQDCGGYKGHNILQLANGRGGHSALNEDGEELEHCWWIERSSQICECTSPTPSANISELF